MKTTIGGMLLALALACGCSWSSAAMTGGRMGLNLAKNDTHLRIFVDGLAAEQNKLKKAATGYSKWKVKDPIGTAPKVRFTITEPEKLGRITMVVLSIHQQFEADYSHQAEFTVVSSSQDPMAQMKPDTEYDLGSLPPGFKVMNLTGQQVGRVDLKPGLKYQMSLTVRADKSETAQVEFKTR